MQNENYILKNFVLMQDEQDSGNDGIDRVILFDCMNTECQEPTKKLIGKGSPYFPNTYGFLKENELCLFHCDNTDCEYKKRNHEEKGEVKL